MGNTKMASIRIVLEWKEFEIRYGWRCVMVVKSGVMKIIRYGPYVKSGVDEDKKVGRQSKSGV